MRDIKIAHHVHDVGTVLILVVVLRLRKTLFHRISHLMNCINRKEGHPLSLVRAQGLIERLPRVREPLNVG